MRHCIFKMKKANTADRFLKIMDSHDMFQTLEKELGSAVRRLENQRIQQKDESSLLLRDLRRSQEEGEELKQKLIVAEKSLELHQEEEKVSYLSNSFSSLIVSSGHGGPVFRRTIFIREKVGSCRGIIEGSQRE